MYSTIVERPGVLIVIDVPNPEVAYAITGIAFAAGTVHNPKLTRLMMQQEVGKVRRKPAKSVGHTRHRTNSSSKLT